MMRDPFLIPGAAEGVLQLGGVSNSDPILVSLHTSARMKLLGARLGDFDPMDPEISTRILRAALRFIEPGSPPPPEIVLTALDLD